MVLPGLVNLNHARMIAALLVPVVPALSSLSSVEGSVCFKELFLLNQADVQSFLAIFTSFKAFMVSRITPVMALASACCLWQAECVLVLVIGWGRSH